MPNNFNPHSKQLTTALVLLLGMFIGFILTVHHAPISRESNVPPYKVEPTVTITARP